MVGQSEGAAGGSKSRLFGLGALYRIGVVAVLSSKQKKKKRERERDRIKDPQKQRVQGYRLSKPQGWVD